MKYILILFALSFAQTTFAETIVETIAENKKWIANKIDNHSAWTTSACVASTLGDSNNSILEIYAEKLNTGEYAEPTIQLLFAAGAKEVFSGEASTENGKKWNMTRASTPIDPNVQALIARIDDRDTMVDNIKKYNTFTVKLKDVKGKTISTLKFSLSGSSKTVSSQFENCQLSFDVL